MDVPLLIYACLAGFSEGKISSRSFPHGSKEEQGVGKFRNSEISFKFTDIVEKHTYLFLSAILLLAFIIRIIALLSLKESIYFDFLLWDERLYHNWAMKIADGTFQSSSVYDMAPLPAYFMAFIYRLFSPDVIYIRIVNIVFGVLTCYLIYLIGKEMASRTVGLIACLIACLYKPFIFYNIVPLKTTLSVFLFALAIHLFMAVLHKNSIIKVLVLGIVVGLMLNVRPNCVVIIPFLPLVILWNIYKDRSSLKILTATIIVYIVGLFIALSPFIARNYRISGLFVPISSQSGYNFYIANNLQNPDPYYRPLPFASSSPFEQGVHFTIEASRRVGKKLSSQEASSYWTNEIIKMAGKQPIVFLRKIVLKTLAFFNQFEAGDHYHIGFTSNFVKFFKIPFFSLWLILPFGMAGMATSAFKTGKLMWTGLIFILYGSTLVVFFTSTRFRLPLLVILIPFAVVGVKDLISHYKNRQIIKAAIFSGIFFLFLVVEFLPVKATDDMTAYYNTHALILKSKGSEDEAIQYWEKSSQMNKPYSAFANLSLAGIYFKKRDIKRAVHYLDKISDNSFAAARKSALIGDMMRHQRKIEKAISAYERSLEINSGQRRTLAKLFRIYRKIDKEKALRELKKLKYISSFYDLR